MRLSYIVMFSLLEKNVSLPRIIIVVFEFYLGMEISWLS